MSMRAAVLHKPAPIRERPLSIEELPLPEPGPGELLIRVEACGVCRTDLHVAAGELPPVRDSVIPGHQIVGHVAKSGARVDPHLHPTGSRVGVCWIGGVDGTCRLCLLGAENLCDQPTFTGYTVNGGYAEFTLARADFCIPLPPSAPAETIAPLLCAGIVGFRSLRVAEVQRGQLVGLFGFGASAHLMVDVLRHWGCKVYVSTRGHSHQQFARSLSVEWVGDATDKPPVQLDRAITFAPSGDVVVAALSSLRKGGIVAINAIHLDRIPQFDYDTLLWGERQIRSVANLTRQDARDFITLAGEIGTRPKTTIFTLEQANQAMEAIFDDAVDGAAVIDCRRR